MNCRNNQPISAIDCASKFVEILTILNQQYDSIHNDLTSGSEVSI